MRKVIAWPMFLLCFWSGCFACWIVNRPSFNPQSGRVMDRIGSAIANVYQAGMRKSLFWDRWGNLKQWSEPT